MAKQDFVSMYKWYADAAADRYNIPRDLFSRLIMSESSFNPNAVGPEIKGKDYRAVGIAQFIPETAKRYGVDPTNATQSLLGAAKYLSDLKGKYGNWDTTIAAYKGFSNLTTGAQSPLVQKVVSGPDYVAQVQANQVAPLEVGKQDKAEMPKPEESKPAPSGQIWMWSAEEWQLFFRNKAIGAVIFIAGFLLIAFSLYVAVMKGGRSVLKPALDAAGAIRGAK